MMKNFKFYGSEKLLLNLRVPKIQGGLLKTISSFIYPSQSSTKLKFSIAYSDTLSQSFFFQVTNCLTRQKSQVADCIFYKLKNYLSLSSKMTIKGVAILCRKFIADANQINSATSSYQNLDLDVATTNLPFKTSNESLLIQFITPNGLIFALPNGYLSTGGSLVAGSLYQPVDITQIIAKGFTINPQQLILLNPAARIAGRELSQWLINLRNVNPENAFCIASEITGNPAVFSQFQVKVDEYIERLVNSQIISNEASQALKAEINQKITGIVTIGLS